MTHDYTITVYSRPNCQQCMATKRAMEKKDIAFTDAQVDDAPQEVMDHIHNQKYTTAPVVIVTDSTGVIVDSWSGFRPDEINRYQNQ